MKYEAPGEGRRLLRISLVCYIDLWFLVCFYYCYMIMIIVRLW